MECLLRGFMICDGLLCFAPPKGFSLSRSQTGIGAFLIVDHFSCASLFARRIFLWRLPGTVHVDRRGFQSDFLWRGRNCQRTEQPIAARSVFEDEEEYWSWLELPSGSPQYLQRGPMAQGPWFTPKCSSARGEVRADQSLSQTQSG